MKKLIIPIVIVIVVILAAGFFLFFNKQSTKFSALQINSLPQAKVFLDNKEMGKTPYSDEKLKPGEYTLKLEPLEDGIDLSLVSWTSKIKLTAETMTVVNWQMGETENASEGETLSLEPASDKSLTELAVITSNPDSVEVSLDNQKKGNTPLILKDLTAGDHELILSKSGYNQRIIPIKTIQAYRLTISAQLSQSEEGSPSAEKEKETEKEASDSATPQKATAVIKETETGWLRVRFEPTLNASEAAKVNPGDEFPLLDEKEGWTQIEYEKGQTGWVSSEYVEKKAE